MCQARNMDIVKTVEELKALPIGTIIERIGDVDDWGIYKKWSGEAWQFTRNNVMLGYVGMLPAHVRYVPQIGE